MPNITQNNSNSPAVSTAVSGNNSRGAMRTSLPPAPDAVPHIGTMPEPQAAPDAVEPDVLEAEGTVDGANVPQPGDKPFVKRATTFTINVGSPLLPPGLTISANVSERTLVDETFKLMGACKDIRKGRKKVEEEKLRKKMMEQLMQGCSPGAMPPGMTPPAGCERTPSSPNILQALRDRLSPRRNQEPTTGTPPETQLPGMPSPGSPADVPPAR